MSTKVLPDENNIEDEHGLFSCKVISDGQPCKVVRVDKYAIPGQDLSTDAWIVVEPGKVGRLNPIYVDAADFLTCLSAFRSVSRCLEVL